MLLAVPFLDELGSGLPVVGAPALEHEIFASFIGLTFAIFTLPQLISLALEAKLLLLANRFARRHVLRIGLGAYGLGLAAAALSPNRVLFTAAWTLAFLSSGIATGTAQAELMDRDPDHREQRMAEWTLAAAVGDLSVPLLLAVTAALGRGYRSAWCAATALFLFVAFAAGRRSAPKGESSSEAAGAAPSTPEDEAASDNVSLLTLLRSLRHNRRLLGWLLGTTLCSLMDEPLAAFCALWMQKRFASEVAASVGVAAFTVGGFLGLVVLHRLLVRRSPRALLLASCLGSIAALVAWLNAGSLTGAAAALALLGASAAAHYPLAAAAAYRALPHDSNAVAALNQFFGPIDLMIPLALGLVADRMGVGAAVAGLLLQPVALLLIAALTSPPHSTESANEPPKP